MPRVPPNYCKILLLRNILPNVFVKSLQKLFDIMSNRINSYAINIVLFDKISDPINESGSNLIIDIVNQQVCNIQYFVGRQSCNSRYFRIVNDNRLHD